MESMVKFAEEFKQQVNKKSTDTLEICRKSFWEYEKYINPKFFREDRPHLKIIAITLQALYEKRIIKINPEDEWKIVTFEEKKNISKKIISSEGIEIMVPVPEEDLIICRNLMLNMGSPIQCLISQTGCMGKIMRIVSLQSLIMTYLQEDLVKMSGME